jgi:hypothetical protein
MTLGAAQGRIRERLYKFTDIRSLGDVVYTFDWNASFARLFDTEFDASFDAEHFVD